MARAPANKKRLVDIQEERKFDRKYRDALNDMGVMARKLEHRIEKGWPDNIAPPNFWWECKWINWYSENPISFWSHFDEQQKVMLRELSLRGAETYVVVFWNCGYKGKFVQTMHYPSARQHERFGRDLMWPFADPIEDLKQHVRTCWGVERSEGRLRLHPRADAKTKLDRSAYPYLGGARSVVEGD